ncbi:MAG: pentapeptide repeat-containing protein [Aeromonas popoffii]|uniref:pentapeptide repeat-containing protein n=1 Tax=Aeromonas popoffii TaxID=70856 RepID=UPI003F375E07
MNKEELAVIVENHGKWLRGEVGGVCADLRDADLRDANLRGADLRDADLRGANLRGADLRDADLRDANLRGADLRDADLRDADLRDADLRGADLRGADLRGADLWSCSGERDYIKSVFVSDVYPITYTCEVLQIGCQRHKISEWWEFDDRTIASMDGKTALSFWREWKDTIRMIIEKSPAAGGGK